MRAALLLVGVTLLFGIGCGDATSATPRSGANGTGGAGNINLGTGGDGGTSINTPGNQARACTEEGSPPPGCGDGILTSDEACDDGNTTHGDGCASNCLCVDPGYSCNPPGEACRQIAKCGDGSVVFPEPCDDGNNTDGDGCSSRCKVEIGSKCDGSPSVCTPTTCGDSLKEGAESCDDGNAFPFDGCSSTCQAEPDCSGGACTSECGDGLVLPGEDCDDANAIDGDGCSSACEVESGFVCSQDTSCEQINGKCVLRVPTIFRDFNATHSDFAVNCRDGVQGIVEATLNAQGKPVLAAGMAGNQTCIESASSFAQWYTNVPPTNSPIVGDIVLFDNDMGGFVNRWGPNGEQWAGAPIYTNLRYCGGFDSGCMPSPGAPNWFNGCDFNPATEQCWYPCTPQGGCGGDCSCAGSVTEQLYEGNPLFFPIDNHPQALSDTRYEARIPPVYGYNWLYESDVIPGAGLHNFHFTTEVIYWFRYETTTNAVLEFTGDDDVWVFINGRLAVDLGGLHPPETDSVTVSSATASTYGLEAGNVYQIAVFHAERKVDGSSFKLTLDGFQTARSDCAPVCGDGIIGLGEECDDGVNDGGYGECHAGCVLGAYCGDGIQQEGEDCDDGNNLDGDACGSACRVIIVR
jgi:fibro-slime domain-containing protein